MSIEVLPLGMACNLGCTYCYQQPVRDAGNAPGKLDYDMDAMKATLRKEGYKFSVFGGEPLLVPIDDLAELWRFGYEEVGKAARDKGQAANGIQTNGVLLTDKHIKLMRRYEVGVGVSIDGPGAMNDARWAGTLEATRAATAKSQANLERLLGALERRPSIIVTLHALNGGTAAKIERLCKWLLALHAKGLRHVNVHLLERDTTAADKLQLSTAQAVAAFRRLWQLHQETGMNVEPLSHMWQLLHGDDKNVSCVWNGCDPFTTAAVHGVGPQGQRLNCGRTYKDGVVAIKAEQQGFERYTQLHAIPFADGGCSGCRFFYACKGNCPGTGTDRDWRERTEHCGVLMQTFEFMEAQLVANGKVPFSLDERREVVERMMVAQWQGGQQASVRHTLEAYGRGDTYSGEGRPDHGDVPHGDSHGDSDAPEVTT
ncbi:hypothetical protein LCGC14_1853820 [marine sediment metagenome]|uniref:Radical SAM core domain-containing protein n=1 Tax=marine sediment metagenome TaxID=412755 RepID=A0A0F9IP45_9ZZZZ